MQIQNEDFETYFKEEIQDVSNLEIESLRQEMEHIQASILKEMREDAQKKADLLLEQELQELKSDYATKISQVSTDYHKLLMKKRDELATCVFEDVKKELQVFVDSEQYVPFLMKKIEQVKEELPYKAILYVGKKDEKFLEELLTKCYQGTEGKIDPHIQIGGFRLEYEDRGVIVDETLDFHLEKEKEWFYTNSGLKIR